MPLPIRPRWHRLICGSPGPAVTRPRPRGWGERPLQVLERIQLHASSEHELVIRGCTDDAWHLELVAEPHGQTPPAKTCSSPTSASPPIRCSSSAW
jgi:hypothetical protein